MKILWSLVRVRMTDFISALTGKNRTTEKKRSGASTVAYAAAIALICAVFLSMMSSLFFVLARTILQTKYGWLYITLFGALALAMMFLMSVFSAQNIIFEAHDNEMLLSMPVPVKYILGSRLVFLGIINLFYETLAAIPAFVFFCVYGKPTFAGIIAFFVLYLTLPLLSMALTSLFAWLLSIITRKMRRKTLFRVILAVALMAAYFTVFGNADGVFNAIVSNDGAIPVALGRVPFLYWFGASVTNGNLLYLLIVVLTFAATFALVFYAVSSSYIKIMTTGGSGKKAVYKAKEEKNRGVYPALIRRELGRFFSSAAYILNGGMGLLFQLAVSITVAVNINRITTNLMMSNLDPGFILPVAACVLCAIESIVIISASSVSLEGKNIWIAQSMPVDGSRVLIAKAAAHIIITSPVAIISSLILSIAVPFDAAGIVSVFVAPLSMCVFMAFLGVTINLRFPKLDWINETVAIKQSMPSILSVLAGLGTLAVATVMYVISSASVGLFAPPHTAVIIYSAVLCVASAILYFDLKKNGGKRFSAIK